MVYNGVFNGFQELAVTAVTARNTIATQSATSIIHFRFVSIFITSLKFGLFYAEVLINFSLLSYFWNQYQKSHFTELALTPHQCFLAQFY
jgi:hypothetical protein